jgi:dihydrofolate reductase
VKQKNIDMRKIICYVATSLDGKIADAEGGVEWLDQIPNPEKSDFGYYEFYESIDCTIMGNATYRQVLNFGVEFPYSSKDNYVITHNTSLADDKNVSYISSNHAERITELKNSKGKDIWCVGGAGLIGYLLEHKLLDELRIIIMPVLLGSGIPLVNKLSQHCVLLHKNTISHKAGVVELIYRVW